MSELDPADIFPGGLLGEATPRAGLTYRLLRLTWTAIGKMLRLRIIVQGRENLPRGADGRPIGGWIAAGMPHRTWIDPFVIWVALPAEPRLIFFGDAEAMSRAGWRRFLVRRMGGVIPIRRGGGPRAFAAHLAAGIEVLHAGGVFTLMPEVGPPAPVGQARPFAGGLGYLALRSGAPIVALVLGGTHDLYFGRRIILRILPPFDPLALAGLAPGTKAPPHGSRAEREAARRLVEELHRRTAAAIREAHGSAEPPPGTRRRLRWLTRAFH